MTAAAAALLSLAALLRSGLSLRQALWAWPDELTGEYEAEAREIVRRLDLGLSLKAAVEASSLAWVLLPAISIHLSAGVDLVAWLERVAADRQDTVAAGRAARSAAAGAALSGRMVAGLPLLFVPLTPMARAPLTDAVGVAMLATGVLLALAGLRWIARLLPQPPEADPAADLCVLLSAMLTAGLSLSAALEVAALQPGAPVALVRAHRLVSLGSTWSRALDLVGGEYGTIAASIRRAQRFGLPLVEGLDAVAATRRAAQRRSFEEKIKRAPVLMVVPLTCCVLPAYALLALGPFLRSMSIG